MADQKVWPIPFKGQEGQTVEQRKPEEERFYKNLNAFLETKKAEAAMRLATMPDQQQPSAVREVPAPWQGLTEVAKAFGIDLGALWQTREKEIEHLRLAATQAESELHTTRLQTINESVLKLERVKDDIAAQKVDQSEKSFAGQMDKFLGGRLIEMLAGRLFDGGQDSKRSSMATLVQEVADGLGMTPEEVRERLRGGSAVDRALATGSTRTDVLRIILENELDHEKIRREDEREKKKLDIFGPVAQQLKESLPDFISAISAEARAGEPGIMEEGATAPPEYLSFTCSGCKAPFTLSPLVAESRETYPCPSCGEELILKQTAPPDAVQLPQGRGEGGTHGAVPHQQEVGKSPGGGAPDEGAEEVG